jgi:hypothetical protein
VSHASNDLPVDGNLAFISVSTTTEAAEKMLREGTTEREFEVNDFSLQLKNLRNAPVTIWVRTDSGSQIKHFYAVRKRVTTVATRLHRVHPWP